jgi:hypothetical protein
LSAILYASLLQHSKEEWVDWEDIIPTAEWRSEIRNAIDAVHTFVYVISPASAVSEMCRTELDCASHERASARKAPLTVGRSGRRPRRRRRIWACPETDRAGQQSVGIIVFVSSAAVPGIILLRSAVRVKESRVRTAIVVQVFWQIRW